ncbi:MAG TPA: YrzE family protein [Agromyces sp.]|nr:YrzE family protein [Agromyces sp.]
MTTPREPADRYPDQPTERLPERHVDADRVDRPTVPADRADVRSDVVDRQREQFGGVKIGSAFFGWLTAVGTAVLLTAVIAAAGAALGLGVFEDPEAAVDEAAQNAETIGWIGAIALLIILFVAYWCGGYVAGRMARFNGVRQGIAVWLWAVVIAIVVALISLVAGAQFDILLDLNSFPRIPVSEGDLTVAGIITAIVVALASLGGAILGGMAGTNYHRRVDRAGLVDVDDRR